MTKSPRAPRSISLPPRSARSTGRPASWSSALGLIASVTLPLVLALCPGGSAVAAERHDVIGTTFEFIPRDITIAVGDTVQWVWDFGTHTVTEGQDCTIDDPLFNALLDAGNTTFRYVFDTPGLVEYFCIPHCLIQDMKGTVLVTGGMEPRVFEADADGSQMVPPVESDATAKMRAYLSPGEDQLHVQVKVENLVNEMIGCHLHLGAPGSNGPMLVNLGIFEDSLAVDVQVQPTLLGPLRSGNIYLAVHTDPYPVGELRGQVSVVDAGVFDAVLDATQEVNAVDSDGVGFAQVYAWPDGSRIHVDMETHGLTSPVIGSHIHEAPPGEDGPIRFDLGTFEGRVVRDFATTPAEIAVLESGGYYLNVHTEQYLFGEIRGQIGFQSVSGISDDLGSSPGGPGGAGDGVGTGGNGPGVDPLAFQAYPSVSDGRLVLEFELSRAQTVSADGFALTGRRIGGFQIDGRRGRNQIPVNLEDAFGTSLPHGRIFLRLQSDTATSTRPVTIQ
ncbi:MAG: CHRD domain-containing protein [Candidatus Eisenbacteria bacterium]